MQHFTLGGVLRGTEGATMKKPFLHSLNCTINSDKGIYNTMRGMCATCDGYGWNDGLCDLLPDCTWENYESACFEYVKDETDRSWKGKHTENVHFAVVMAIILCLLIIAFTIAEEVRDIKICELSEQRKSQQGDNRWWIHLLRFKRFVRQFVLVPHFVEAVVAIIVSHPRKPLFPATCMVFQYFMVFLE